MVPRQQMFAQVVDDFSDGDFTKQPPWLGSAASFEVTSAQLHLNAPPTDGTAYLYTSSNAIENASWEFTVRLAFNPSGSNYARLYLSSSKPDLTSALNGYYVMIGGTADEVSLYRQIGTTHLKIIDGLDGRVNLSNVNLKVKVTRNGNAHWTLLSDSNITGTFNEEGQVTDNGHASSAFAGIFCQYTSTRSTGFYFDDIVIQGDSYISLQPPHYKDIIFTEILPDPSPIISLPDAEFIELYNRSAKTVNLSGWTISDATTVAYLPSYSLAPASRVLLTATPNAEEFGTYGTVLGVAGFPSLGNSHDVLMLKFPDGTMVDSIHYAKNWYKSKEKAEGGWSLELIDVDNICGEENNWIASDDAAGGTPGTTNSISANKPDITPPKIISITPASDAVGVYFNEKLSKDVFQSATFLTSPALPLQKAVFKDISLRTVLLQFSQPLQPKTQYALHLENIKDCAGNNMSSTIIPFVLPEKADTLDVLINEVLFNPTPTGIDFIEIVNASDKYINLKNWSIASLKNDAVHEESILSAGDQIIAPNGYRVFTEDKAILMSEYSKADGENISEVPFLPSMNDDQGSIMLLDSIGKTLDGLAYSKNFHSVFIKNDEGVSLERISFVQPAASSNNWKSASAQSGYATPGYVNSNAKQTMIPQNESVQVDPEIFEPITGQPNFTQILYNFQQGGYIANAVIYDAGGRVVKRLGNNTLLGTEGYFRWDGDRDDGTKAQVGYYMVWLEVFDASGTVRTFRKRLAVATQF